MNVKELNTEYPEHLNPFRSRTSSISKSFRGFTRAIARSFRGKDKEKPVIRPKPVPVEQQPRYLEPPVAFPRSRFSERLSKTDALRQIQNASTRQSLPDNLGKNPFDDDNEQKKNESKTLSPPKPVQRTKLKRKKKRAPIPPDSMTVDGYLSASVNGSKWSLTSTESDMSSMYYSESEIERRLEIKRNDDDVEDDVKNEEILKITREIAQFTEDTNNNSILNAETPNEETNRDNTNVEESEKSNVIETNIPTIQIESPPIEKIDSESNNNMPDVIKIINEVSDTNCPKIEEEITVAANVEEKNEEDETVPSVKIDEMEEVEIRLANSDCEIENRHSVKQTIEFFEYSRQTDSPTPKIRKNILTKEKLLGSEL